MSQLTRVALVVLLTLAVVLASAIAAALLAAGKRSRAVRRLARVSFSLLGCGGLALGWGLFIEADWLEVTRVTVTTKKWPAGKTLRIAHLSDLHLDTQSRALSRVADVLRKEPPDLLVFTGDSINERDAAPLFHRVLGALPARLGRFAVRGNHDTSRWADVDLFGGGVATELINDAPVLLENDSIALCGAPFNAHEGVETCLKHAPHDAFVIFAYHTPDLVEALAPQPDLYLAGHTHGGQIALPFYGALVTFSRFDKKYESGRAQFGKTTIYVNRGIGFEPHLPKVRLFARPELTFIDVVGQ